MEEIQYIDADEFLAREKSSKGFFRIGRVLNTKEQVKQIVRAAQERNVALQFEDNPEQPNSSCSIQAFGDDGALLRFVAYLVNNGSPPVDIVTPSASMYADNSITLWWD